MTRTIDTIEDVEIIRNFFTKTLDEHSPDTVKAVSWGNRQSQFGRFQVLAEIASLNSCSILDVGCGCGDLFDYLQQYHPEIDSYHGIDIHPKMAKSAAERFPHASFESRNILEKPLESESFDYVFASGVFGLETPNWMEMTHLMLRNMFETCRLGMAVNFLSRLGQSDSEESHFADPSEIFDFISQNLSNRVTLRHDYRNNDFTVYVFHQDKHA